jgi:hypothetical protein
MCTTKNESMRVRVCGGTLIWIFAVWQISNQNIISQILYAQQAQTQQNNTHLDCTHTDASHEIIDSYIMSECVCACRCVRRFCVRWENCSVCECCKQTTIQNSQTTFSHDDACTQWRVAAIGWVWVCVCVWRYADSNFRCQCWKMDEQRHNCSNNARDWW